jgi:outer membrane protein W
LRRVAAATAAAAAEGQGPWQCCQGCWGIAAQQHELVLYGVEQLLSLLKDVRGGWSDLDRPGLTVTSVVSDIFETSLTETLPQQALLTTGPGEG